MSATEQDPGGCGCPSGACQICFHVLDCSSAAVSGTTVTVSHGGTTTGTCTTDGSGNCCVDISGVGSGTYQVAASKSGYASAAASVAATCPGTTNVTLKISASTKHQWKFTGCNGLNLPGVSLAITGVGTFTSDANGEVNLNLATGSYPWTATRSRFTAASGTEAVTVCVGHAATISMSPSSGYHCFLSTCVVPAPDTMHLTDSMLGVVTITYQAVGLFAGSWYGSLTANAPAKCGCPAVTGATVDYQVADALAGHLVIGPYVAPGPNQCPSLTGARLPLSIASLSLVSCEPVVMTGSMSTGDCGSDPNTVWWTATPSTVNFTLNE